jgi:hypothetical protein
MKLCKGEKLKGSITLEMSIVFPIVFVVILLVLLIGFYMSDIVCIRAVMQKEVLMANERNIEESEIYKEIKDIRILSNIDNILVWEKNNYVYVKVDVSAKFPILNIYKRESIEVNNCKENNKDYVVNTKIIFDIISH